MLAQRRDEGERARVLHELGPARLRRAEPRGQTVELNRDEYSRPPLKERAEAYKILIDAGVMGAQEVRDMERLHGDYAASALAGTTTVSPSPPTPSPNGVQQGDVNNAVGN